MRGRPYGTAARRAADPGRVSRMLLLAVRAAGSSSSPASRSAASSLVAAGERCGDAPSADTALQQALDAFVKRPDGPTGSRWSCRRGDDPAHSSPGTATSRRKAPFGLADAMRLASVAKAFSGAAAVSAVADGKLTLDATVGEILPDQPAAWANVTLAQLLQHTSGIPDFSKSPEFQEAVGAALDTVARRPRSCPAYVAGEPLNVPVRHEVQVLEHRQHPHRAHGARRSTGRRTRSRSMARVYEPLRSPQHQPAGRGRDADAVHPRYRRPAERRRGRERGDRGGMVVGVRWRGLHAAGRQPVRARLRVGQGDEHGHTEASSSRFRARQVGAARSRHQLGRPRHLPLPTSCGTVFGHTGNTPGTRSSSRRQATARAPQWCRSTRRSRRSATPRASRAAEDLRPGGVLGT